MLKWIIPALVATMVHPAAAGVVAFTGDVESVPTPALLVYDVFNSSQSNLVGPNALVFPERLGYVVPDFHALDPTIAVGESLHYQVAVPGSYPGTPFVDSLVPIGALIETYIVHFDPDDETEPSHETGSVTFDRAITGIMVDASAFQAPVKVIELFQLSNVDLSLSSGLEFGQASDIDDSLELSADRKTLTFDFRTNGASEDLRIIFLVPEPSAITLFGISLTLALFLGMSPLRRGPSRASCAPLLERGMMG